MHDLIAVPADRSAAARAAAEEVLALLHHAVTSAGLPAGIREPLLEAAERLEPLRDGTDPSAGRLYELADAALSALLPARAALAAAAASGARAAGPGRAAVDGPAAAEAGEAAGEGREAAGEG